MISLRDAAPMDELGIAPAEALKTTIARFNWRLALAFASAA